MPATTLSQASTLRLYTTARAACRANASAVARPMPLLAPVTTQVLSLMLNVAVAAYSIIITTVPILSPRSTASWAEAMSSRL